MAMKSPVAAVHAVAVLIATALTGCAPTICNAMGYVNVGPVELNVSGLPVAPTAVAVCFGDPCTPARVTPDRTGRWMVAQTSPYVQPANAPIPIDQIRVVAVEPDQSISDRSYAIAHTPPRGGCDNTYELIPVRVTSR